MTLRRRDFVRTAAAAGGALALGARPLVGASAPAPFGAGPGPHPQSRSLRILILGGTGFIGPHQVRYARERGHTLTLFNRGQTAPELFPGIEQLRGDRATGELDSLGGGREWDVVIDNSASDPRWVRDTAQTLKDRAGQYIFVSTQSTYASRAEIGIDETAPVGRPDLPKEEWRGYGPLKALCEEETRAAFPDGATVVRPSLIVGPGDGTDRWTYWAVRVHRGGNVLAPGTPQDPVQFIDARDLSEWMIRLAEAGTTGTFNAVGPGGPLTMVEMLYGIRAVTTTAATFTFVPVEVLRELGIRPWSHMPAWQPPVGATAGFARMSNARALAAGLTFRPLADTARDTLRWFGTLPADRQGSMGAGVTAEKERWVLETWRLRRGGVDLP